MVWFKISSLIKLMREGGGRAHERGIVSLRGGNNEVSRARVA